MFPLRLLLATCALFLCLLPSPALCHDISAPDPFVSAYIGTPPQIPWGDRNAWPKTSSAFIYGKIPDFPWPDFRGEMQVAQETWIDQERFASSYLRGVEAQETGSPLYWDSQAVIDHHEVRFPRYRGYDVISKQIGAEALEYYEKMTKNARYPDFIDGRFVLYNYRQYFTFLPSEHILSLLCFDFVWDTHGWPGIRYTVTNFDLRTEEVIPQETIFLDHDDAYPAFITYVAPLIAQAGWDENTPSWCREEPYCIPPWALEAEYLLERLVFSQQGATLLLTPGVYGSHQGGFTYVVDIPKSAMLELGANPAMWGE